MGQLKQELDRRIGPRFNNRPALSPRALGEPDPRFSGGLGGFIAQDPMGFAKGLGSAPFTAAPDILGLVQQGSNALGNVVQRALGLPEVGFQPISGDPIRESIGLDPQSPQGLAGEVVSPVGTIAKGLGIAAKSVVAGAKLAANTQFPAELAMVLFHGSPFKFDKFKLSQIGTGEGAQAFGHGLYFAENKGVATSYSPSGQTIKYRGEKIDTDFLHTVNAGGRFIDVNFAVRELVKADGNVDIARKSLLILAEEKPNFARAYKSAADKVDDVGSRLTIENTGNIYEVEIPDNITAKMLDWDAPLSIQDAQTIEKAVRTAADIRPVQLSNGRYGLTVVGPDGSGSVLEGVGVAGNTAKETESAISRALVRQNGDSVYRQLSQWMGGDEAASQALREAGIPGIKYFDGGSRNRSTLETMLTNAKADLKRGVGSADAVADLERRLNEGTTRNIVVFNPDDITQVKRDGGVVFRQ